MKQAGHDQVGPASDVDFLVEFGPNAARSVVIPPLQELDAIVEDLIHQAVSFRDPARPDVAADMLQVLGPASTP